MSIHTIHPDTREHGLADGCPRCDEHAERPLDGLDNRNIEVLVDRIRQDLEPRSDNEATAIYHLRKALETDERLLPFLPVGG